MMTTRAEIEHDLRKKHAAWQGTNRLLEQAHERVLDLEDALGEIATWAEYGYQDLNSGGVLSCVKKRAREALDGKNNG